MAYHIPDITITDEWMNLTDLYPEIVDRKVTIQAKFVEKAYIFAGSEYDLDEDSKSGSLLLSGTAITGTASSWQIRGKGTVSIFVEDE